MNLNTFSTHHKRKPLCTKSSLSWLWSWPGQLSAAPEAQRMTINEKKTSKDLNGRRKSRISRMKTALVARVDAVRNSQKIVKAFPRFIVGLVLVVWVAPYADVFYTKLDFNDRVSPDVWYYESFHWLFLCLGPYLKGLLNTIGLYLCFVHKASWIKSAVMLYCLAYDAGKITWLLQVSNHDEYKQLPSDLWIYGYGLLTSAVLLVIIELLSYWLNHRILAVKARLQGLRNIADKADPQIISNGFVKTMDDWNSYEAFNSRPN